MNTTLSHELREDLWQSFYHNRFSFDTAVNNLVNNGYEVATARELVNAEWKAYRHKLFNQTEDRSKSEEAKKAVFIVVFMISVMGPVFDITSAIWYICAAAIAGGVGYWGYKTRPIAGMVASLIVPVAYPIVYDFYFTGRTSYIQIELLIPMAIAALPAIIAYFVISKTVYANTED